MNSEFQHWLQPVAEPTLKVARAGRNCSLVARTSMCVGGLLVDEDDAADSLWVRKREEPIAEWWIKWRGRNVFLNASIQSYFASTGGLRPCHVQAPWHLSPPSHAPS